MTGGGVVTRVTKTNYRRPPLLAKCVVVDWGVGGGGAAEVVTIQ